MKIETDIDIGQLVAIPDLENQRATVRQICVSAGSVTYQCEWFWNGELKSSWLHRDQIRPEGEVR